MPVMSKPAGEPDKATIAVGDLARATGLSVRVLRHWETEGLVTPTRSASGHRRYDADDVVRVLRAVALRRTGLSLRQVASLLDGTDNDPAATFQARLTELDDHLRRGAVLRRRLASLAQVGTMHGADVVREAVETMTMFEQYVHGYRDEESRRLRDQASTLADLLHNGLTIPAGSRVLEIGCGVGAQTHELVARHPGITLVCLDRSAVSLATARARLGPAIRAGADVTFVERDLMDLPSEPATDDGLVAAGSYDHAFVCFVLEHLEDPAGALRRARALLRPGGTVTVIEGDHGSTHFHPEAAAAREVIDAQVRLQAAAGGDAMIGGRLHPLLTDAGFDDVSTEPRVVLVDGSRPDLADGFIRRTFTAMVAGVRQQALVAGLMTPERFDEGIAALHRTAEPDGMFSYTFFRATAVAPG